MILANVAEDLLDDVAASGASAMEPEVMFSLRWVSILYTVLSTVVRSRELKALLRQ